MNEPLKMTMNVGDGIVLEVRGSYGDLIWFYRYGQKVAEDNIRDGDNLHYDNNISWRLVDNTKDDYVIAIRHGRERDLVYGYVMSGTTIIRSPRWRDLTPGPTRVSIEWPSSSSISIDKRGILRLNRQTNQWHCEPGPNASCEGGQLQL